MPARFDWSGGNGAPLALSDTNAATKAFYRVEIQGS